MPPKVKYQKSFFSLLSLTNNPANALYIKRKTDENFAWISYNNGMFIKEILIWQPVHS